MPEAIEGASGAYQVAGGKRYQAVHALCDLRKHLSSDAIVWQPQPSSAQALLALFAARGEAVGGDNLGLRHNGRRGIIVPEINN